MTLIFMVQAKYQITATYKIEDLNKQEYATLSWLSDHGYDAGILELISGEEKEDGGYKFDPIPEHVAWEIMDRRNEDEDAFLTSNGSRSLGEKILEFMDAIV